MGMPEVIVNFRENQNSFLYRLGRGTVCYVHIESTASTPEYYTVEYKNSAAAVLEDATGADDLVPIVQRMFDYGAARVLVVVATAFTAVEDWLENQRFNYLAVVSASDADAGVISWAESIKFRAGRKFVLITDSTQKVTNADNDHYVVSIYPATSTGIPYGSPMDIAAIVAGSTDRSATFRTLVYNYELTDDEIALYPGARTSTANEKNNGGQLVLINDGEKIKVGRAVTTHYQIKSGDPSVDTSRSPFSKVRCVDIMNMIEDDIRDNFENQYVSQVLNDYAGKQSFISMVNAVYLAGLVGTALDASGTNAVDIDLEAHMDLIREEGGDPSTMTEMEIRQYDTGDKLYLAGTLRILDTMEDLVINFTI